MEFFNSAVDVLQTFVVALGAGLGISQGTPSVWGSINLLEGRCRSCGPAISADRSGAETGNDNPGLGITLVPLLSGLFSHRMQQEGPVDLSVAG